MNHLGLFEGIGGFSLAARWMGWNTIAWCEINPFGQRVLRYYWPNAKEHYDIKETDFTIYKGKCFILTGGFPCQPYSQAGKRLGKEDDRHLWPEMLRAVREIQPRWVVGENVRGLVNWSGGLVFDEVQTDLEAEGYEVQPFILPACAKNAPHRRDRIWFVAYSNSNGHELRGFGKNRSSEKKSQSQQDKRQRIWDDSWGVSEQGTTPYSDNTGTFNTSGINKNRKKENKGRKKQPQPEFRPTGDSFANTDSRRQPSKEYRQKESGRTSKKPFFDFWQDFPTQSPICSGNDGLSSRLVGITFPKFRNESIKAYGNAIVPQIAFEIFKAIEEYEK